jgi:hypothetical protein
MSLAGTSSISEGIGLEAGKCEEGLAAMFWRTFKNGFTA